jgi:glycosyltransferase involved in cell wall biosynthesis
MNAIFQPLVSIIVPVYNTEKFLTRAIDSILVQTYENIELILVNDGSVDRSGEICDQYARKNSRIKVIHQPNGGVSTARNAALDVCSGEYIQFVDSDDEIESTMTEKLVNEMRLQDCDIVICGLSIMGQSAKKVSYQSRLYPLDEFLMHAYLESVTSFLLWGSCFMLIKNSIIRSYQIRFDSTYNIGEDGLFTLEYLHHSKSIYVLDQALYRRYVYEPEERISAISHCTLDVYKLRIDYFNRLFSIFEQRQSEHEKSILMASFYDKLIAGLVRLGAYSEYYSDKELNQRLADVVNNEISIRAARAYKRKRKGDSILIPLFMRWRKIGLLKWALRRNGKNYIRKYGKQANVCSVYKDTIIN